MHVFAPTYDEYAGAGRTCKVHTGRPHQGKDVLTVKQKGNHCKAMLPYIYIVM